MEQKEFDALVAKVGEAAALEIKTKMDLAQKALDEKLEAIKGDSISKKELEDAQENFKAEIKKLNEEMTSKLVEQGKEMGNLKNQTIDNTLDFQSKLANELSTHKEGLEASTKKGRDYEFTIKADTLRASVVGNPNALDLTDVGQMAHRKLTVYDIFRKVPVPENANGVVRYVDWDADTVVRAAAAIAEGGTFPESTAKWTTGTLTLQKVGDIIPASEELMYDAALFASELQNFLETNVAIKIDTDLVTGNGTAPNITGLKAQIPNYTAVAAGITDASIYDLLVKVRETITVSYGSKYSPNVALMNISDINKMKLKKDTNNNYILPPFFNQNGQVVDGITVIECNAFTANTMAVGDSRYGAIYEIPGMVVETGKATGDFENDMMSIKARKRLNLLIRNVDRTGWLEVTSISAALTTLAS